MKAKASKAYTKEEVTHKMENQVKKIVKHYRSDFYDYDLPRMETIEPGFYLWSIHESGTHLVSIGDTDMFDAIHANWRTKDYILTVLKSGRCYFTLYHNFIA